MTTGYLLLRRGDRRAAVIMWVTYLGAVALYALAKPFVARPRPPAADLIGHATGLSFPSGHAAQALAAWSILALVLTTSRSRHTRIAALAFAGVIVLAVGVSRVYLGAHWLTDVLAGYTLTATWLTILLAWWLRRARPCAEHQPVPPAISGSTPGSGVVRASMSAPPRQGQG